MITTGGLVLPCVATAFSHKYSFFVAFPLLTKHVCRPYLAITILPAFGVCISNRECHGFTNPYGLRSRVVTGTGTIVGHHLGHPGFLATRVFRDQILAKPI